MFLGSNWANANPALLAYIQHNNKLYHSSYCSSNVHCLFISLPGWAVSMLDHPCLGYTLFLTAEQWQGPLYRNLLHAYQSILLSRHNLIIWRKNIKFTRFTDWAVSTTISNEKSLAITMIIFRIADFFKECNPNKSDYSNEANCNLRLLLQVYYMYISKCMHIL